jgi:acetolactate synthase I/II/III large subunit
MNGAESLIRTATANGLEVCFSNPGTTEMHLVAALDSVPGMRGVLALFEGVVTGAADGYGRMAGKPALTLLHLGPGFANGIANLHNARRAQTPILNLIGHHATWQRNYDPPLNSDVETLAAPVSDWQRTCAAAGHLSRDLADALAACRRHPGRIATLVVPADAQWDEAPERVERAAPGEAANVSAEAVERVAAALREEGPSVLLLGAHALREAGQRAAARIAAATGARLVAETFPARLERGPHLPALERLPYFPEQATAFLQDARRLVLAGAREPVAFFGYAGGPSRLAPEGVEVEVLAGREENAEQALLALADALDAPAAPGTRSLEPAPAPSGALDPAGVAQAVVAALPERAIVVDEGVTAAGAFYPIARNAPAHTYLTLTGGAIGYGMPCAIGAAIACPDRKVIVLEGDGSGLYTNQALWTQAREGLDIVNVVFANNLYRILQIELHRSGVSRPGPQALALTELARPAVDWHALGKAFGVPTHPARTAEELHAAIAAALAAGGPQLVVAAVP